MKQTGYPPSLQFKNVKCVSKYMRDVLVKSEILLESTGVKHVGINPEPFLNNPRLIKQIKPPLRLIYFGSVLPQK